MTMRDYAVLAKHLVIGRDEEFEVSAPAEYDFDAGFAYINNLPTDKKGTTYVDGFLTITSLKIAGLEMLKSEQSAIELLGHRTETFKPVPVSKGDPISMKGRYTGKIPPGYTVGDGFSLGIIISGTPRS